MLMYTQQYCTLREISTGRGKFFLREVRRLRFSLVSLSSLNIIFGLLGWVVHRSDAVSSMTEWSNLKWTGLTGILRDFPPWRPKCRLTPFGDTVKHSCMVHEPLSLNILMAQFWLPYVVTLQP